METRPFDIAAAKKGMAVCTADGRKARILCYDYKHPITPLLVAVMNDEAGGEETYLYTTNGRRDPHDRSTDLVMTVTRHEGWINIYLGGKERYTSTLIYHSEQSARETSERNETPCVVAHIEWYE